ncbi:SPOSA6832_00718, partial [Sporobolomyces salmonicolor]
MASSPYVSSPAAATSSPFASLPSSLSKLAAFDSIDWTSKSFATSVLAILITLLVAEQTLWRYRKAHLPGHSWQIVRRLSFLPLLGRTRRPVIGQFAESLNPTMEAYKRSWSTPLATVSFIVIASTTEYARKILNSSTLAEPCLVRSAKQVLLRAWPFLINPRLGKTKWWGICTAENWVFLNGKVHNEYRKGLNSLFTPQALQIYLRMQDSIYRKYFRQWVADPTPEAQPYQMKFRDLNMETSLRVFCGSYIREEDVKEISDKYWLITQALELVNFPFAFPGTKVWNACRAREVTVKYLMQAAAASKKAIAAGKEPDCLLDEWVEEIHSGKVRKYENKEMALVLLSVSHPPASLVRGMTTIFIFTPSLPDAMSSSITFAFQLLADHPEVLAKIREEQTRVRAGDLESAMSLEWLEQMPYTNAVTKEVLRYRPPVIMVPYLTKKPFPINDEYTVPKGTMLIPSFWNVRFPVFLSTSVIPSLTLGTCEQSLHDPAVYPDPEDFVPERFMPGGANHGNDKDAKNWLVFGAGAHKCIGQNYVYMHMSAVIGSAAMLLNWEHERTPESDEIQIIATLFPKDGCRLKFTPREDASMI